MPPTCLPCLLSRILCRVCLRLTAVLLDDLYPFVSVDVPALQVIESPLPTFGSSLVMLRMTRSYLVLDLSIEMLRVALRRIIKRCGLLSAIATMTRTYEFRTLATTYYTWIESTAKT
ncbi:hypothetical protein FKP32DRAFT_927028 [Trametes sanguinea]|nr:hypothetical protein FKP32DRAFT_927028 [Trametes sanguinea]